MQKTELKFNSQVCTTREQSKRLLDLGLKPETADCQHFAYTTDSKGKPIPKRNQKWVTRIGIDKSVQVCGFMSATFIPAWSLHRLLLLCDVTAMFTRDILETVYDDHINAIENIIKNGYFNKEYLKQ